MPARRGDMGSLSTAARFHVEYTAWHRATQCRRLARMTCFHITIGSFVYSRRDIASHAGCHMQGINARENNDERDAIRAWPHAADAVISAAPRALSGRSSMIRRPRGAFRNNAAVIGPGYRHYDADTFSPASSNILKVTVATSERLAQMASKMPS